MAVNEKYYTDIQSTSIDGFTFKYANNVPITTGKSTSKTKNTFLDPSIQFAGTILPEATIVSGSLSSLTPRNTKAGNYLLWIRSGDNVMYPNITLNTDTYNNLNYNTSNQNFLEPAPLGYTYTVYPITGFSYKNIKLVYSIIVEKDGREFAVSLQYFNNKLNDNVTVKSAYIEGFVMRDKAGNWEQGVHSDILLGKPSIAVFNNGQYTYELATCYRYGTNNTLYIVGDNKTKNADFYFYPASTRKGKEWLKIFCQIAALQCTADPSQPNDDTFAQSYNKNGYPSGDPIQNPQGDDPSAPNYMPELDDTKYPNGFDPINDSGWDGGKGQNPGPEDDPSKTINSGDEDSPDYDPTTGEKIKSADENNKLPTINLFNRTFALTVGQVRSLADELWNADDTRFEEIKNGLALMGGNPIQGLIDLRLYPIDFGSWAGSSQNIVVGRTSLDTQGRLIETNTLPQFSCSLGTISGQYGNFMDYEPFSIFQIYLPFVGTTDIPANLVIGHEISCKASVDIITGAISYIVKADGYPILYKNGTIGVSIPMTADNAAEYALGVIHATNNVVQTGADTVKTVAKDVAKATSVKGAITDPSSNVAGAVSAGADIVAGASAIATAGVDLSTTVNQTTIQQSGTASPSNSLYTSMSVYILQEYHNPVIPSNYAHDIGIACRLSGSVGSFSGYTQFSNVDLTGINCTESERTIILETLQNGVYL